MRHVLLPVALVISLLGACGRGPAHGVCDEIQGMWHGEQIEATGGQDPDAIRVVSELVQSEQWRFIRVTPTAMQRERVGLGVTRAVAEPLTVRENNARQCVMDLATPRRAETLAVSLRANGRMAVTIRGGWYTALFHRP